MKKLRNRKMTESIEMNINPSEINRFNNELENHKIIFRKNIFTILDKVINKPGIQISELYLTTNGHVNATDNECVRILRNLNMIRTENKHGTIKNVYITDLGKEMWEYYKKINSLINKGVNQ